MPNEIFPPDCMMKMWKVCFPKLDWSKIKFYDSIPFLYSASQPSASAVTVGTVFGSIKIYLAANRFNPCDRGSTFQLLTHELVHAVQIQSQFNRVLFTWKYLTCYFADGMFNKYNNCYEAEGRNFASTIAALGDPCPCSDAESPFNNIGFNPIENSPVLQQLIIGSVQDPNTYTKTRAACDLGDCFGNDLGSVLKGSLAFVLATIIAPASTFFYEGAVSKYSTIGGAIGGMLTGLALGLGYGGLVAGGLLSAVVGAVIGFIGGAFALGLVGALVDWFLGLFPQSTVGGSLNIVHSTDKGLTWKQKATFQRTQQQPSLCASETSLHVGWTGLDDQLYVISSPAQSLAGLERSGPCGPAIAVGGGKFFLCWKGTNGHPNCASSFNVVDFGAKFVSGADGWAESTPGLAFGRGMIYMSWVGPDNHIRLAQMRPEDPIREEPIKVHKLNHKTGPNGTPALAFGDGELFMAWSRFWPSPFMLNIMRIPVDPDGFVVDFDQEVHRLELTDFTNDTTGPALAFSKKDGLLYLAFTGADDGVYVMSLDSTNFRRVNIRRLENELSRSDTGPGIAVHPSTGTVFVCWVGKDGD